MRKNGLVVLVLAACSGSGARLPKAAQGPAVIEIRGAVKNGPFSLGHADLQKLPQVAVRGVDPTSGAEAVWEGVPLAALMARVELGRGADTVIVRTADGAAIPIPLTVVRQFRPTLADRADGTRLATRVLAWPTLEQRGIETDPRHGTWWARDIVALELADWQRTYAVALATPEGAPDAARRGSTWYAERCVTCHKMRGVAPIGDARKRRSPSCKSDAEQHEAHEMLEDGRPHTFGRSGPTSVGDDSTLILEILSVCVERQA